jgi:hypothetical protein
MSGVVLQNHEDEKNSGEFFAVAGAPLTYTYRRWWEMGLAEYISKRENGIYIIG